MPPSCIRGTTLGIKLESVVTGGGCATVAAEGGAGAEGVPGGAVRVARLATRGRVPAGGV
jgi:hypothetical protein